MVLFIECPVVASVGTRSLEGTALSGTLFQTWLTSQIVYIRTFEIQIFLKLIGFAIVLSLFSRLTEFAWILFVGCFSISLKISFDRRHVSKLFYIDYLDYWKSFLLLL